MRKILVLLFFVCVLAINAQAQSDDLGRITVQAYVPPYEGVPNEAAKLLQTKLSQIIMNNGIADNEYCVRFILTAKINVISKDIVAGPPQRISQKLEITLILGDIEADKVYSNITLSAIGIGTSLEKSYIAAIKNIRPNNAEITEFMKEGKNKVVTFYTANCNLIIDEAKKLANMQNYDEAISQLLSVPNVCKECYDECSLLASQIYNQKINAEGAYLLRQAQGAWAEQPNKEGAAKAIEYLSGINFASSCRSQVNSLMGKITQKLISDDKREWELKVQQYQDKVEQQKREWNQRMQEYKDQQVRDAENRVFAQQKYADDVVTQRMVIRACRDVSIEYAKNQPKKIINYNRIYTW